MEQLIQDEDSPHVVIQKEIFQNILFYIDFFILIF